MDYGPYIKATIILWSAYAIFLIGILIDYAFNDLNGIESIEKFFIKIFRRNRKGKQ
jgi:hypothetical protein